MRTFETGDGITEAWISTMELKAIIQYCLDEIVRGSPTPVADDNPSVGPWAKNPDPIYKCLQRRFTELTGQDCSGMPVGMVTIKEDLYIGPGYFRQGLMTVEFFEKDEPADELKARALALGRLKRKPYGRAPGSHPQRDDGAKGSDGGGSEVHRGVKPSLLVVRGASRQLIKCTLRADG